MRAGLLRHKITLQAPAGNQNSVGERVTTWADTLVVRAAIEPLRIREQHIAAQNRASTTHKIMIRYSSDTAAVDASWRVKYGSRIFTIDGPPKNIREAGRTIELACTEGLREE